MKKKHNSQLKVVDAFKQKGIEIDILNLDVSTKTSQEAADAVGCDIEQIAKSIVFFESIQNKLVQIFVSGPNKVNLESFQNQTNLRIEKADAEYVRESTGFAIGGVAPLGHKNRPLYLNDLQKVLLFFYLLPSKAPDKYTKAELLTLMDKDHWDDMFNKKYAVWTTDAPVETIDDSFDINSLEE